MNSLSDFIDLPLRDSSISWMESYNIWYPLRQGNPLSDREIDWDRREAFEAVGRGWSGRSVADRTEWEIYRWSVTRPYVPWTGTCVHRCVRGVGSGVWGLENRLRVKARLYTFNNLFQSPLPQPLAITIILSVSMSSAFLDSTCKWDHTVLVFLCLSYFT